MFRPSGGMPACRALSAALFEPSMRYAGIGGRAAPTSPPRYSTFAHIRGTRTSHRSSLEGCDGRELSWRAAALLAHSPEER